MAAEQEGGAAAAVEWSLIYRRDECLGRGVDSRWLFVDDVVVVPLPPRYWRRNTKSSHIPGPLHQNVPTCLPMYLGSATVFLAPNKVQPRPCPLPVSMHRAGLHAAPAPSGGDPVHIPCVGRVPMIVDPARRVETGRTGGARAEYHHGAYIYIYRRVNSRGPLPTTPSPRSKIWPRPILGRFMGGEGYAHVSFPTGKKRNTRPTNSLEIFPSVQTDIVRLPGPNTKGKWQQNHMPTRSQGSLDTPTNPWGAYPNDHFFSCA